MMNPPSAAVTMCLTLLDEWSLLGVRDVVVSPGSRSTPMVLAIEANKNMRTHVFHDERSAAFAALGIATVTGAPAMLICTSGTAAAEFFPAIAESSQACVPLIVCTADRPPELQGIGAPQTMNQFELYGDYVRRFLNVAPAAAEDRDTWRDVAREAWISAMSSDPGPVHVNLQFREPLVGGPGELPPQLSSPPSVSRTPVNDLGDIAELCRIREGLIVAGAGIDDPSAVLALGERLGWPVAADPRSGCRTSASVITHLDSMVRHSSTAHRLRPKVILRFGSPPVSKVVNQWIASSGAYVVSVSPLQRRIDPELVVSRHIVAQPTELVNVLEETNSDQSWLSEWRRCEEAARSALSIAFDVQNTISEPWLAREVAGSLASDELLFVSSSMPIRDVEWFADRCPTGVYSNRGVNGIDGVTSTAIGVALGADKPVTLLIGDIAYLHDSNALINLVARNVDVRVVVIDNSGGGIFSFLDQARSLETSVFERFFGTPHGTDLTALARAHGVPAVEAKTRVDVQRELRLHGPRVVVVKTDRVENVREHERLNRAVADALDSLSTDE